MAKCTSPARIAGGTARFCSSDPYQHERRADGVERHERQRHAGAVRLVVEEVLLERRATLPAVLLRPADAELAVASHLADQLAVRLAAGLAALELGPALGRHQRREVLAQLLLERALLGRQVDVHGAATVPAGRAALQHVLLWPP